MPNLDLVADRELTPDPGLSIELARHAQRLGQRDRALTLLTQAVHAGGWRSDSVWAELVAIAEAPTDYIRIRDLWLASPPECHRRRGIMRSVAWAACMVGEHKHGRTLLRAAILQQARQTQPPSQQKGEPGAATVSPGTAKSTAKTFETNVAAALRDLDRALVALRVRSFLVTGTFLGLVRDGNLPEGKDISVGVFRTDFEAEPIRDALDAEAAFSVHRLAPASDALRIRHRRGVHIELYFHYEEAGRLWHDRAATRRWNEPFELEESDRLGVSMLVPADAERYLTESYGDWRSPDPDFVARLDAPNLEITDQAYFDSLLFFGLLDALLDGEPGKCDRYRTALEAFGESAWLQRVS